jgi:hypothetical protein
LPLWLWVSGAAATIVLTFAVVAVFVRERRSDMRWRADLLRYAVFRAIAHPAIVAAMRWLAVALLALSVCAGLSGAQSPYANVVTPMVWVVWWVGIAFLSALGGDVWAIVNPLRTLFGWAEALCARVTGGGSLSRRIAYPRKLGAWPAVVLFIAFAWCELIWHDKDVPRAIAGAVLGYAAITWAGMFVFGRDAWLRNGDAFALAFGVLARFAPLDIGPRADAGRRCRLGLRPPGAGLLVAEPVAPPFLVFVLLMLATVTFDGFQETPLMQRIDTAAQTARASATLLFALSEWGIDETQAVHTLALVAFPLLFVAIFLLVSWAMLRAARRSLPAGARGARALDAACAFVLTLVPIAVAYHLSHYLSLLLTAGQFIIPLASDPFGFGWNLFGTATYKVDFGIVSPYFVWYSAVGLIVVGHLVAVLLAHAEALRFFGSRRAALASQLPMMLLMVAYTTLSLWIFAQPIVG